MPAIKKKGFGIGLALFVLMLIMPVPAGLSQLAWYLSLIHI